MRHPTILLTLFASLAAGSTACNPIQCADGTIEKDGVCTPATVMTNAGKCGPFTELQGDQCVPLFPPTECDPGSTAAQTDPATGVTTCIGMGGGGCGGALACPAGTSSTKLTVCGQLYDFQDNSAFATADPKGQACNPSAPDATGPCSLQILAYDAIAFGTNPSATPQLPVTNVYIDDCGRYRLTDIDINGTGPFIAIGIDDAGMPLGPAGNTVTVGIATSKPSEKVVKDFEGWIVKASTVGMWQASGGPPLSGGIYSGIFRAHKKGNGNQYLNQAGATITKSGNVTAANDYYFAAAETSHQTIDAAATATGANGTGLYTGASVADSVVYGGQGGLGAGCRWDLHAGASLPGIVFIQVFRKIDIVGMTCND